MDHPIFLRAVLEDPADDTPRLVYADWLEEYGREENGDLLRAELIRLQCRRAGCRACDGSGRNVLSPCPCTFLHHREQELLGYQLFPDDEGCPRSNAIVWADTVYDHCRGHNVVWRRGFVEEVTCTAERWWRYGSTAVLATQPVTAVHLWDGPVLERGQASLDVWVRSSREYARLWERGEIPRGVRRAVCETAASWLQERDGVGRVRSRLVDALLL